LESEAARVQYKEKNKKANDITNPKFNPVNDTLVRERARANSALNFKPA
jgi:hypothetical protein